MGVEAMAALRPFRPCGAGGPAGGKGVPEAFTAVRLVAAR